MLPNAFVVLWDNLPIHYLDYQKPIKTTDIRKVHWFRNRIDAESFVRFHYEKRLLIKEIQFRIMDEPNYK